MIEPGPPARPDWRNQGLGLSRLSGLLAASATAGWAAQRIGTPLPWMLGPLVVTALLCMTGLLAVKVPDGLRPFGQIVVASQVGLTFTPQTLERLIALGPVIVTTALATLVCILVVAFATARSAKMSFAQSFLAAVPTSPVEAAAMAVDKNVDAVPVIMSQTLRLSAVVLVLPLAIYTIDGWPASRVRPGSETPWDLVNITLLLACGFAAMRVFRFLRIPNPNFLGPLTATAVLAATGHGLPPFPPAILAAAQIVLGSWLGATFRREFLGSAGRMAMVSLASILSLLLLCSLAAAGIASAFGMDWRLLVLGAAPGGVVEMVLTAKFLGQDPTVVTAFHLTRIFLLMPNIPWIVALLIRYERRRAATGGRP